MMLITAAAVLIAILEAQTAQAATKNAVATHRTVAALREAKSQADDATEKARAELDRVRVQTAEQLAASRTSTDQAESTTRAELEQVRASAAKAVADAQEAADAAIQQAITERDRMFAERAAELRQQIEQVKVDAQAQVKAIQEQADAAKAAAEQLIKALRDELADATGGATPISGDLPGRRISKMTPVLVDKAQRMYDSGRHTVAEIAKSFAVSPTTIYRHIHTGRTTAHAPASGGGSGQNRTRDHV